MAMAETLATRPLLDLTDPRFLSDPYPFYRLLRERAPVWRSPTGLWVLSPEGEHLATLKLPEEPHNLAWGGDDGRDLYITALTSVYRLRLALKGATR